MINLLPSEIKQNYRYARRNRHLVHWAIAFFVAIIGVAVIATFGILVMNKSIDNYKDQISESQSTLVIDDSAKIDNQVNGISNNLKLMVEVLSKEILFSNLLNRLGNITPSNVILTNLSITQDESAIDITAQTADYNAATQLQVNLEAPSNQIFSKADIVSISCATGTAVVNTNYPCTVSIRALFVENNPFLFINSSQKGSSQ